MAVIEEESGEEEIQQQEQTEGADLSESVAGGIASLEIVTTLSVEGEEGRGENDVEDSEEEEEEEEEWGRGGLRGFLQKAEEPWKLLRQYFPSKAGGAPAWLDPVNLPRGKHMLCGICDKPLQFVLQVYAPAEDDDAAFHRTLFVFICTSLACLQQDELQQCRKEKYRSLKVFRTQLPRQNPYYSSNPLSMDRLEPPLNDGVLLCSWCGTWKGDKVCGGCKQTRYCSQFHQLEHWRGDHAPYCRRVQEQLKSTLSNTTAESATTPRTDVETPSVAHPSNLWPEFELVVDDAGAEDDEDDLDGMDSRTGAGRLLADYERRRMQGSDFSSKDVQDVEESSLEEQHWASFQAKVSKSPEQILWYHRSADAKPLWPKLQGQPKESDIPACSHCGGERTFEFQILPQLPYYFEVKDGPDSVDWGTIAVYSCAQSCKIQGYCEEFAWMQPGFT